VRHNEQISTILRKHDFTNIHIVHLDRTKGKANRAAVKAFAAKVDSGIADFQDADVILISLTVKHKHS
jgi:hypothetical protein